MSGYNNTAEDKLLLSRAYDAIELSERRSIPKFLGFLNEHEQSYLRDHISPRHDIRFFGGYDGAVRVMLGAGSGEEDFPITALEFSYKPGYDLRHRDFLGSLMAMGIRRDTLGDILTEDGRAVVFVRDDIVPFVMSGIDKIGRVGVKVGYADTAALPAGDAFEELTYPLSSLRLDVFTSAATGLSRDKAARMIKSELVAVDHVISTEVSRVLHEGATVTIRKYGKFVLSAMLSPSRKGKLRVRVKHFR